MDIKRIERAENKYFKMEIKASDADSMYENMKALFTFIAENYNHGRKGAKIRGNAYCELLERTNKKLGASGWHYHGKRKVAKKEIQAFVQAYDSRNKSYKVMRIPYKAYYIMESITECIDDLKKRNITIPSNLQPLCGELYRIVFMRRQIELFETEWRHRGDEWLRMGYIAWYLHDDFMAEGSPFNKQFWK